MDKNNNRKIFVLGVDGGTWNLLDKVRATTAQQSNYSRNEKEEIAAQLKDLGYFE